MPGRDPRQAVQGFLDPLNESTRCLLPASWAYRSPENGPAVGGPYTALLNWGQPVPARGLSVTVEGFIAFTVMEQDINRRGRVPRGQRYKVSTRAYYFTLLNADNGSEILAYHWHPEGKSTVTYPHMHIGTPELSSGGLLSRKDHLPSGRMAFEHVLIMLSDRGAEPLRPEWHDTIHANLERFMQWRTWH